MFDGGSATGRAAEISAQGSSAVLRAAVSSLRPLGIGGPSLSNSSDLYQGWLDGGHAILG